MFGLTQLGVIHTAISLIAVSAGLIALFRDKEISPRNGVGKIYIIATVLTCRRAGRSRSPVRQVRTVAMM